MQDRLIIIVMPFIFLLFYYGTYEFAKRYSGFQTIFILIYSLSDLLMPVFTAIVLAYLLEGIISKIEKFTMMKTKIKLGIIKSNTHRKIEKIKKNMIVNIEM